MANILFIGGPGNISSSCAAELLSAGHDLSVYTRSTRRDDEGIAKRCRVFLGERMNQQALAHAIGAVKPEAIIDFCCFTPEQLNVLLPLLPKSLGQYVFISTVDVYGYPLSRLPMRETDPLRAPNCRYAADKRACEALLRQSPIASKTTIFRPAYSMGRRFALTALSRSGGLTLVPRLTKGLPILSPGDGQTLIHASNARDTGRMTARVVLNAASLGVAYNGCAENPITYDEYVALFAEALGVKARIVHVSVDDIYQAADYRIFEENLLYDLTSHHTAFSTEAFLRDFPDFRWQNPVAEAVREFIEYQQVRGGFQTAVDIVEDSVLARL